MSFYPTAFDELVAEVARAEKDYTHATDRLRRLALQLLDECKEHKWVWCDYEPMQFLSSLAPCQKCLVCKVEYHTWNGLHGGGPGPKISRHELYKLRYRIHVDGEIK